jgi:hypothetical protein
MRDSGSPTPVAFGARPRFQLFVPVLKTSATLTAVLDHVHADRAARVVVGAVVLDELAGHRQVASVFTPGGS